MKNQSPLNLIFCFLLSGLFNNLSQAQDCLQSTAGAELNANNVEATLMVGGDLWWDGGWGQYFVPKPQPGDPAITAFHLGAMWIGGFDSGENLKLAGQTYGRASGKTDYFPGPLTESGQITPADCNNFDRFWTANSTDINTHLTDWSDNGVIDGPIPQTILAWPGKGNPFFEDIYGFELPFTNQALAPFQDLDADGIYNPQNGDYPDINSADQGKWWVFNDAGGVHSETGGSPVQFEIQVLAYAYSSQNDNVNNATFYDYKFINRSIDALDSAYVAFWADPDLGCYIDDYVGCDTANNLAYVYNRDALDGNANCDDCLGLNTYCEEIPLVGIKLLSGVLGGQMFCNGVDASDGLCNPELHSLVPVDTIVELGMTSFMYYNGNLFPGGGSGNTATDFYSLMTASWPNGTRLTAGGDGYDPASTNYTNYAFPGPPNDTSAWSMCSEGIAQADRRMIIGSGPFNLEPGGINKMSFAVLFAENVTHPCPDISPIQEAGEYVQNLFDEITSIEKLAESPTNIQFQPNPMTNQAELIFNEMENSVQQISIYSIDGKQMRVYNSVYGKSLTIERNGLGQGMYFYKILTDDFKVYSGKFIVQ